MNRKERRDLARRNFDKVLGEESEERVIHKETYSGILGFFEKNYKKLLIFPFIMLILALIVLGTQLAITGDFVNKGVSLKGGVSVTLMGDTDINSIESLLRNSHPGADIIIRGISEFGTQIGLTIETDLTEDDVFNVLETIIPNVRDNASVETMGPSLGESFFKQTVIAVLVAFVFMAIVVFIYFRNPVTSGAVILAAFSDIVVTLAVVNIMGLRLSTAGVAAFLMLIGYSVDTDILLSTRVVRQKEGSIFARVLSAMKTGLTMQITTFAALAVGLMFSESEVLRQIMTILMIGLIVDIINTWIQNAGLLRWYLENES